MRGLKRTGSPVRPDITMLQILAFAAITGPLATAGSGLSFIAPFYTGVIGFSLGSVGLIMTVCRIYDIVADIIIAYVSDNTRSRFGKRKLWVVIGIAMYIPAAWLLYRPAAQTTLTVFALTLFFFFSAWTIAFIPALTQATELSTHYVTKNKINITQALITQTAIIATSALPFLLIDPRNRGFRLGVESLLDRLNLRIFDPAVAFLRLPTAHGGEIFHRNLEILSCMVIGLTPILLILYMVFVPAKPAGPVAPKGSITAALRNRVFQRFAAGYFFIMCGTMGWGGLFPFIVTYALKLPDSFLFLFLALQLVAIFTTPFWGTLMRRYERSTCIIIALTLVIAGLCLLMVIPSGNETLAFVAVIVMGSPGQAVHLIPNLIAGDCADFAKWKTGTESRAVHTSMLTMMIKVGSVTGAALIWLVSMFGFDPAHGAPSDHAVMMLKICGLVIPALLLGAGIYCIRRFPLTRQKHAAIQSRILRRTPTERISAD